MNTRDAVAARARAGARPGRGRGDGRPARLPHHRLRQVPVRAEEEGERGEEEAGHHHGQGGQVPPRHGRPRLRLQDEARARVARTRATRSRRRSSSAAARSRTASWVRNSSNGWKKTWPTWARSRQRPRMEGNQMFIIFAPKRHKSPKQQQQQRSRSRTAASNRPPAARQPAGWCNRRAVDGRQPSSRQQTVALRVSCR